MIYGQKFDFSRYADYVAYFRSQVSDHPAFLYPEGEKHFYLWHLEDFDKGLNRAPSGFHFLLEDPESDISDNQNKLYLDRVVGSYVIVHRVKADDIDDEIEVASACKQLAMNFLGKLIKDKLKQRIVSFDPNSVKGMKIGPVWDNYFGFRLEFRIDTSATDALIAPEEFTETATDEVLDYAQRNNFVVTSPQAVFDTIYHLRRIS